MDRPAAGSHSSGSASGAAAHEHWKSDRLSAARALLAQSRFADALTQCDEILRAEPGRADALIAVADIAFQSGATAGAIERMRRGIARNQQPALVHFKLGCLFEDLHDWPAAANEYETALRFDPRAAKVHNNLGAVQQLMGYMDDALASFERALVIDPAFWLARYNIGLWMKMQGRFADAVKPVQDALRMRRAIDADHARASPEESLTTHAKLRHDIEQLQYLIGRSVLPAEARDHVLHLEEMLEEQDPMCNRQCKSEIPAALRPRLARTYNRLLNFRDAPAIPGGAVNPDLDHERIEGDYFANGPGITHFDNFLTAEALASLRRFCLESTIWFDAGYSGGYVGSTFEHGFACPLLAQIAEEFRDAFPAIFKGARINGLWGYKYDSERSGIAPHADYAAVNVNFWLTADGANLDPASGGLVVWDREAPLDWDFADYNNNQERIEEFIRTSGANAYVVPHRQNRVVLFNSDLFHRTDSYRFKPGYENRRINITILYGDRQDK